MSGYRGRTGPNFSEYLNSLNSLSSPYDEEQFTGENLDFNQDLAMFTNTDFTHFDIPNLPEADTFNFELNSERIGNNMKYEDLLPSPEPTQAYNATTLENNPTGAPQYFGNYNPPLQPAPAPSFPSGETQESPASSTSETPSRRKIEDAATSQTLNSEEKSRLAAEEDKRRRNTAASARFRIKKKQREQALEKTVKEITDKNSKLETRLSQLEMENKWLKDLLTEKNGSQSKEEIAAAFQKFRQDSEERESKASEHVTGVGTP